MLDVSEFRKPAMHAVSILLKDHNCHKNKFVDCSYTFESKCNLDWYLNVLLSKKYRTVEPVSLWMQFGSLGLHYFSLIFKFKNISACLSYFSQIGVSGCHIIWYHSLGVSSRSNFPSKVKLTYLMSIGVHTYLQMTKHKIMPIEIENKK